MQTHKQALAAGVSLIALMTGCSLFGKHQPAATLAVHEQVDTALPENRVRKVEVPKTGLTIPINPYPALTEKDVQSAELHPTAGGAAIMLRFDIHGSMALQELSTRIRGGYIVTFLDGRPVAAWLVDRPIDNGQMLLEGDFGEEEAKHAVESFNSLAKKLRAR